MIVLIPIISAFACLSVFVFIVWLNIKWHLKEINRKADDCETNDSLRNRRMELLVKKLEPTIRDITTIQHEFACTILSDKLKDILFELQKKRRKTYGRKVFDGGSRKSTSNNSGNETK